MAEEDTLLPADPECSSPRLAETPTVEELEELLNTGRPSGNLHIVVHLPTCLPEEDPGTRDASVQVGVTCEDKATQWEEREAANPSLDKPSGANTTGRAVRKGGEQTTPATSGPSAPTTPQRAVINLLQWVRHVFSRPPPSETTTQPSPRERKHGHVGTRLRGWVASMCSQDSDREHPPTPGPGPPEEGAPLPKRAGGLPPESGMSVAFCPVHRRRIVIYLPTCQPEDPGSRDASVQVGVICEDKATQWEEREEADPSLDKPSGANTTVRVSPLGPRRQVLEGMRNGDCGTRKTGIAHGRM
ncbi:UNVERIFIED_CONTAM: hypothetical protein K2H54_005043 [Gekko kuhli]